MFEVDQKYKCNASGSEWEVLCVGNKRVFMRCTHGRDSGWTAGEERAWSREELRHEFKLMTPFFELGKKYTSRGSIATYKVQSLYQNGDQQFAVLFWEKPRGPKGIIGVHQESFQYYYEVK